MAQLIYGGYGHHPSGKQYVYWAPDTFRTGQNVVANVTKKTKSGQITYPTMFTIQRTSKSEMGQKEANRLSNNGIGIKWTDNRNVMSLPGAKDFASAAEWRRESNIIYRQRLLNRASQATANRNTLLRRI